MVWLHGTPPSLFVGVLLCVFVVGISSQSLHFAPNATTLCAAGCSFTDPIWIEGTPSSFYNLSIYVQADVAITLYLPIFYFYSYNHFDYVKICRLAVSFKYLLHLSFTNEA
jgi:hypothetical protein